MSTPALSGATVYVVSHRRHYESSTVLGVFSDRGDAELFSERALKATGLEYPNECWDIEEMVIDALEVTHRVSNGEEG